MNPCAITWKSGFLTSLRFSRKSLMLDGWFSETFPELSRARRLEFVFDSWELPRADRAAVDALQSLAEQYQDCPGLMAGLWLYAGDWEESHHICQSDESPTGSWWHAIVHRYEGDMFNSLYWYRRVGDHPVRSQLNFDPQKLVEYIGSNCKENAHFQREEFLTLLQWCVENRK